MKNNNEKTIWRKQFKKRWDSGRNRKVKAKKGGKKGKGRTKKRQSNIIKRCSF